ncbi:MAG TPA: nicotinate-nucleotide adenylyltransferase [Longimicrobiaceae bacterium]|nr:nicotinate-nucleotide adenylyltransferase [Longimicrobiaceae bacterium]
MRTGVFGGTFDPPHLGHLIAAADAHRALALDRVLFVPSAQPPHKRGLVRTPAATRLEMVRAAIAGDARFAADDLELRRPGPSYSADTLRELRAREPGGELFFLLGADALRDLPGWHRPDEIARLAHLAVLSRAGDGAHAASPYPALPVAVTRVDVSATEIRRRAARGETIRYLVPEAVRAIVEREGLYRDSHLAS